MKELYINKLSAGDSLTAVPFLVQDVSRRTTKDGRPFLLLTLSDKTGTCGGVFWDVPPAVDEWVSAGKVAAVTGRVSDYKDALQITATMMLPESNPNMGDYLPSSDRPKMEMISELYDFIASLAEPWRGLVDHILLNDEFLDAFATMPAAKGMHHAYIGGLLEHTLSMAGLANMLAAHYPLVDRDLLLAGTLLHDMGKVYEYTITGEFGFSEDGRLLGHIVRAMLMVETAVSATNTLNDDQSRQLLHLIASHHGKQEWGSPVEPKTIEAVLLHQIDMLDSRMQGFVDHIKKDKGNGDWTSKKSYMFGHELKRPLAMR